MTTDEIRKKFLDFFASKGHAIIAGDSLVPKDDPTVLFTTAGMQQFKRQFLGHLDGYTRAATSQKCLRTDDLDQVGKTAFHHTFFEMLGNFSFGDYFKKDAIHWAWEFLTKVVNIPAEKLWVSVYKDDQEAEGIWLNEVKIPAQRLVRLGDKSNFWPSNVKRDGPNGPCGPCSEIFFDYGVNPQCQSQPCDPACACGRFSEVWNLVFTQFNRKDDGILEPLPAKNIDTGMGLERLAAVVQGKKTNFETDLFAPIFQAISGEVEGKEKISIPEQEKRIIADHIRAIVFAIYDGVIPSNKERGFIIKKLINAGTVLALKNGARGATLYRLVPAVLSAMQNQYPELKTKGKDIESLIKKTEEAFVFVYQQRIPELRRYPLKDMTSEQRGEIYFKFQDTFGLPVTVSVSTAGECGVAYNVLKQDEEYFNKLMEQQKDRSRATSKMMGDVFCGADLNLNVPKTEFVGYTQTSGEGKVLKFFIENREVRQVGQGDQVKVVLDKTPFYAESGGQVGDTGFLQNAENLLRITDTQKIADEFIHIGTVERGSFNVDDTVIAKVDAGRRLSIMRNHTATHLLQAALRSVLGTHVQQQGSLVAEDRLRFDFTHPQAITIEKIHTIEDYINQRILACDAVEKEVLSFEEAKKKGALAFFAEKYGEMVRVVSVGDYSKEFCGGTHLNFTGEIGLFKITGESAIAQGIRRLEARTGVGALDLVKEHERQLEKISQLMKVPVVQVMERIEGQAARVKQLEKEIERYQLESVKNTIDALLAKSESIHAAKIVRHIFENSDVALLRRVADLVKQKSPSSVAILGARNSGSACILIAVTDNLVKDGLQANAIIQQVAPILKGSGGGRPQLAQAGSKDGSTLEQAVEQAEILVRSAMKATQSSK